MRYPTTVVFAAVVFGGSCVLIEADTLDATPLTASKMLAFEAFAGAVKPTEKLAAKEAFYKK
jgi:hypothetical protein